MNILIIEDDNRISIPLKEYFERDLETVTLALDGESGLQLASKGAFDLILLDVMLPGIDGLEVCRELRRSGCDSAIIMISARNEREDKIHGLDCGADDYLAKPFELDELNAHVRAVLRRNSVSHTSIKINELRWNSYLREVKYKDEVIELTPTEYRLLTQFLTSPDRTLSKSELLERLWDDEKQDHSSVIKTHIKTLRKKIKAAGAPKELIESVYGVGYRFRSK